MNRKSLLLHIACTLVIVAPLPSSADDENLLMEASFEQQLSPEQGGWELFGRSRISLDAARRGERSMFNGGSSRRLTYPPFLVGTVSGSFQEFPATPGSQWRLVGYGMTREALSGAPALGIVQVSFFDPEGNDLGTVETADSRTAKAKLSNEVNVQSPVGEWVFLDTGVATAPEGTSVVQAFTLYIDYSGTNIFQGVYFDELTLCDVTGDDDAACSTLESE